MSENSFDERKKEYLSNYEDGTKHLKNKRRKALELSLDIRKFEIDLYWKRAAYFWTFIALTFTGYFAILDKGNYPEILIMISCLGLVFSISWYLVNRGSKYWQNNWENHVDMLEDEFIGPLYKLRIEQANLRKSDFLKEYPFSVSKINQVLSLYIVVLWVVILIKNIIAYFSSFYTCIISTSTCFKNFEIRILILITLYFIWLLFTCESSNKVSNIKFIRRDK